MGGSEPPNNLQALTKLVRKRRTHQHEGRIAPRSPTSAHMTHVGILLRAFLFPTPKDTKVPATLVILVTGNSP